MYFLIPQRPDTDSKTLEHGTLVGLTNGSNTPTTHSKTCFSQNFPHPRAKEKLGLFDNPPFQSHNCAKTISRSHLTNKNQQSTHRMGTPYPLENSALLKFYLFSPSAHLLPTKFHHKICPNPPTMFKF